MADEIESAFTEYEREQSDLIGRPRFQNRAASLAVAKRYFDLKGNLQKEMNDCSWEMISAEAHDGPIPVDPNLPQPAKTWCESFQALSMGDRVAVYDFIHYYRRRRPSYVESDTEDSDYGGRRRKTKKTKKVRRHTKKAGRRKTRAHRK